MSDHDQRPDSPIWRQIVGTVWRVEKETWREAALIGLVGGVIGAGAAGTLGYQLFGWAGLLAGAAGGFFVGWVLLVLFLQSASVFQQVAITAQAEGDDGVWPVSPQTCMKKSPRWAAFISAAQ